MIAHSRGAGAVAGVAIALLTSAACGSMDDSTTAVPTAGERLSTSSAGAGTIDCTVFDEYGDMAGSTVSMFGPAIPPPLYETYEAAWAAFESCTGVDVRDERSIDFETEIVVRLSDGDGPDVATFPQPAFLAAVVRDSGAAVPLSEPTQAVAVAGFTEDWLSYGRVDGVPYGFPFGRVSTKSLVWYSPRAFDEAGYGVPETWSELMALSDQVVADNPDGGVKPWCAGIEEGPATGWPLTDWVEDVMLRQMGPRYYDEWASHSVPFNSPESLAVWETVGSVLRNLDYVNGGVGDVASIASTSHFEAGLPILDGSCLMTKAASFQLMNWPQGTRVAPDGDIFAFHLPGDSATEMPIVVGADYVAAFADRPEVHAFMAYLASGDFHRATTYEAFGLVSPHQEVSTDDTSTPFGTLVLEQFHDDDAVVRFDGSDLMPGTVGAGSFWREGTRWIAQGAGTQEVLDAIEASWPS